MGCIIVKMDKQMNKAEKKCFNESKSGSNDIFASAMQDTANQVGGTVQFGNQTFHSQNPGW